MTSVAEARTSIPSPPIKRLPRLNPFPAASKPASPPRGLAAQSTPSLDPSEILADFRLASLSRHVSYITRREVLNGRAKFGVSGDGKELAQLAMARVFQKGDFRAGYYRDQTFMFALDMLQPQQFFAQLYADASPSSNTTPSADPATGGRAMVGTFATRWLDENGDWLPQTKIYNSSADISPTAGQMPRLVGLAYASRLYRELDELKEMTHFSRKGSEVAFGTIGNASCAEGLFWESLNAIAVLQSPAVISIWDDDYGISVPNEIQFAKGNVGPLLEGFRRDPESDQGFDIYTVRGWDYPAMVAAYETAAANARISHIPAIIHVTEMTQPQGHTTSGSHERYKDADRLAWEAAHDPLAKMRKWIEREGYATPVLLDQIDSETKAQAGEACENAWEAMLSPLKAEAHELGVLLERASHHSAHVSTLTKLRDALTNAPIPHRKLMLQTAHQALPLLHSEGNHAHADLLEWRQQARDSGQALFSGEQMSADSKSPLSVETVAPIYPEKPQKVAGYEILRANFDAILANDPRVSIFGEDVGNLGDVNQGVADLQRKYGQQRVADTGIREAAIIGRAIGMAMRGLRPIPEIQYIDYILYAMTTLSDDLATVQWRSAGGQKAPVIVRTRGHRLEGVWHSGSPMASLIHLLRGMHIVVPRNMTQAAGFYNTLLQGDDPALVVECLNAYRQREELPSNPGEYTVPLGVPETLQPGEDVTVITYGACCPIVMNAAERLAPLNISVEVIDVQSLLPFDIHHSILESVKKTNRVLFVDEDMPGGTTAYMMQQVLEEQGAFRWLDSEPKTISAQPHRPAYGNDGDYFSKPNVEDVTEAIYAMMRESDPAAYPAIWGTDN